jgi:hypothetical protein
MRGSSGSAGSLTVRLKLQILNHVRSIADAAVVVTQTVIAKVEKLVDNAGSIAKN